MVVHVRWLSRKRDGLRYAELRWMEGGTRQRKTLGYVTPTEAEDARAAFEARLLLQPPLSPPSSFAAAPSTVDELILAYLTAIEEQQRGTARYRRHELLFCKRIGRHLGPVQADRVGEGHLRRLVVAVLGEAPEQPAPDAGDHRAALRGIRHKSSALDLVGCLRRVFRHGQDVGLVDHMPPRLPRNLIPDDARPPRQLTEADVRALIAAAGEQHPWLGRLVQFLAWCPRRPIAVFALRRKDCARAVDASLPRAQRKLFVSRDKGGVGRGWSPITEPALDALLAQLEATEGTPDALVWTSARGRPLDAALLAYPLRRAAERAGLEDVHVYDLRKFGATAVYGHTGNLNVTQLYTGHRDVRTLFRYLAAPRGAAEDAAGRIGWTPGDSDAE